MSNLLLVLSKILLAMILPSIFLILFFQAECFSNEVTKYKPPQTHEINVNKDLTIKIKYNVVIVPNGKNISLEEEHISVEKIQNFLNLAGYNPGKIDGIIGPNTSHAFISFYNQFKLKIKTTEDLIDYLKKLTTCYDHIVKKYPTHEKISLDIINKECFKAHSDTNSQISKINYSSRKIVSFQLEKSDFEKPEEKKETNEETKLNNKTETDKEKKKEALYDVFSNLKVIEYLDKEEGKEALYDILVKMQNIESMDENEVQGEDESKSENDEDLYNILSRLQPLQDIEYIDKEQFWNAIIYQYQLSLLKDIEDFPLQITEQFITTLKEELVPDNILNKLKDIETKYYKNKKELGLAVLEKIKDEMEKYRSSIMGKAKKNHKFQFIKTNSVNWSGSCGCLHNFSNKIVYGFYPFWMAGKEEEIIDFSLISRIGYFALPLGNNGKFSERLHWTKKYAHFIKKAHKYQTKVDIVIYNENWYQWTTDSKYTDTAIENIVSLISTQVQGDGITLYSGNSSEKEHEIVSFFNFFKQLKNKLKEKNREYYLNILLPANAFDKESYILEHLEEMIPDKEIQEKNKEKNLFMVFLEDPTTVSKKTLRNDIESQFTGFQRKNMLRKTIPVIIPASYKNTHNSHNQLKDDLTYFEDNFRGVGFWPVPIEDANMTEEVYKEIQNVFVDQIDNPGFLKILSEYLPDICTFACPWRAWIRGILITLISSLSIFYILTTWICQFRADRKKYSVYFIGTSAITLLVFFMATSCDPFLKDKQGVIYQSFAVLIFLRLWYKSVMKIKKTDLP